MQPDCWQDENHDLFGERVERDVFPAQLRPGGHHAAETMARTEHGLAATTGRDGVCSGPETTHSPASGPYRRLPGRTLRRLPRVGGSKRRIDPEVERRKTERRPSPAVGFARGKAEGRKAKNRSPDESRPAARQASRPARGPAVQLWIAVLLAVAGLTLLYLGVWLPPEGEIHSSLLVAFGETSTFAGALFGVDYQYRYGRPARS